MKGNSKMIREMDMEKNTMKTILFLKDKFQMEKDGKELEKKLKIKVLYLKENIKMEKEMEKEKNIIAIQIVLNTVVIIQMEKEVVKGLNILKMVKLNLQEIL